MSFSLPFFLVSWILLKPLPARAQDGGRELSFPAHYFFAEKRLVNHTIISVPVKDLDECEYRCYLIANCVSLNIKNKDPTSGTHDCELNNSTHLEDDGDLKDNQLYYYRGAENHCGKNQEKCQNNATCLSGFTSKKYRCVCNPGFEGEHCEHDVNECTSATHKCHANADCVNIHGSYNCTCKAGYTGDGRNCTDIDECVSPVNPCTTVANSECNNTHGSYNCQCKDGFVKNGANCEVDICKNYQTLTDAERKYDYVTDEHNPKCDNKLDGWYRFQGAAGTKMATTCPPEKRCDANFPAWLSEDHPTVGEGTVKREVCIHRFGKCCDTSVDIQVKNCGPYYIYELNNPRLCETRYCSTD